MHSNIYWVPTISQHDARVSLRKSHIFVPSNYLPADLLYCYMYVRWHIPYSQSYGFSSSHVWMWELNHEEGWVPKNWCFWTAVLEKTLESPLDCKEIKPVNPKENQHWIFIRWTGAELKLKYFGHLIWKANSLAKILMLGKIESKSRRGQQRMRWLEGTSTQWTWVWTNSGR